MCTHAPLTLPGCGGPVGNELRVLDCVVAVGKTQERNQ